MLIKKHLFNTVKVAAVMTLLFTASSSFAQEMTAEHYISMDLQARQLTLEGVKDRLSLLQFNAGLGRQLDQDAETQQDVGAVYQQHNMTASRAIAWATQHTQAIIQWLKEHPDQQAEYDRISRELDAVSTQIQALSNQ
ncbi:MAG: hypothetical protein COB30_003210 [Ectothiorhodospiraceae bacterium]|nr:hypothetical protein [Ectothiorhodospiraceae bacterium]